MPAGREVARLRGELGVSDPLAQVLVRRGLADPGRAGAFLAGAETHPPEAFAGIGDAIEPILRHAAGGGLITVHGDYDVDGVCATAVLLRTLRRLGAERRLLSARPRRRRLRAGPGDRATAWPVAARVCS